jgi:hypothetical protein
MAKTNRFPRRIAAAVAAACVGLTLAGSASAVDLRDWGRKFNTASERFVVLAQFNNEAVLDKETQLIWQRTPGSVTSWTGAYQNCLVTANGIGGRYGWRLPSFSELSSLLGPGGTLPTEHPFLNIPGQILFWSSTDVPYDTDFAYLRALTGNFNGTRVKQNIYPYLCVRGVGTDR